MLPNSADQNVARLVGSRSKLAQRNEFRFTFLRSTTLEKPQNEKIDARFIAYHQALVVPTAFTDLEPVLN